MSQETPGLEQRGVDIVPKNERTVGFWDLFIIWAGFSIIMTNFLLGALGIGIGIGPAMIAHVIGILIVAAVVWLGTILGSEQGIAGTVAMRSAFGINGRYIASIVMFIVGVGWFGVQTGMVGGNHGHFNGVGSDIWVWSYCLAQSYSYTWIGRAPNLADIQTLHSL